jgi:hypothetical protein
MRNFNKRLELREADAAITEMLTQTEFWMDKSIDSGIRILKFLISYVENQFMSLIAGQSYRETRLLLSIIEKLTESYRFLAKDNNCKIIKQDCFKQNIYYLEKSVSILQPWLVQLDSDQIHTLDADKINFLLEKLSHAHMGLSSGRGILARETFDRHQMLRNSEIGLDCSDKARYYAEKLIVGENRTDLIYNILSEKSSHLLCLRRYNEAKIVLEEVYDLMATTYCLDHPLVLKTANLLVKTLIVLKEYYDAQRFASICYEILTRPIDTESDEVADAAYSLARVSFYLIRDQDAERGGEAMERDLKFMEMLLRKAIRIKVYLHTYACIII